MSEISDILEATDDFLAHHGIKGQKWGVRRFQNEDGTLTEEGKKRYGSSANVSNPAKSSDRAIRRSRIRDVVNRRRLSDKELKEKVSRLETEKKLKDMTDEQITPGEKFVKDLAKKIGSTLVFGAAGALTAYTVKSTMEAAGNMKEAHAEGKRLKDGLFDFIKDEYKGKKFWSYMSSNIKPPSGGK